MKTYYVFSDFWVLFIVDKALVDDNVPNRCYS